MLHKTKRIIGLGVVFVFAALSLSACSSNNSEVASWWVDQRWETADAS